MAEEIKTNNKKNNNKSTSRKSRRNNISRRQTARNSASKNKTKKQSTNKINSKNNKNTSSKKETTKKINPEKITTPKKEIKLESEITKEDNNLEKTLIFDVQENKNIKEVVKKLEEENIVLEDKVIKRSKGKKIAIIILSALITLIIIGVTIFVINNQIKEKENNQTINSNIYKKVSTQKKETETTSNNTSPEEIKYSNIKTVTLSEFEEKILKKEDMTILIASTTCYACITFEPVINEALEETEKTIYRIDVTSLTEKEIDRFRTYYAFTKTPTIFTIKNGLVKSELIGTTTKEELITWISNNM